MSQSSILIVGVAYKPEVSDVRESPAYDVIGLLDERGAEICYYDPYVSEFEVEETKYESVTVTKERLEGVECD